MANARARAAMRLGAEAILFGFLTLAFSRVDSAGPKRLSSLGSIWTATDGAQQGGGTEAQSSANSDASREDRANFEQLLGSHPIMQRQLESNPSLVNDPHYVQNEPDLGIYLSHHPDIKAELEKDPRPLLQVKSVATDASPRTNAGVNPSQPNGGDTQAMNHYLDQHQDVDQQLKQNPALIDDASFLGQHQDLQALLNSHPQIKPQFEQNPAYFTHRQWHLEPAMTN